nr:MAG TPA: hypothetical protein [Caudoviricetes sp.]
MPNYISLDKHFLSALHSASRGVENLFKAESHRYCDIFTSIVSLPGCLFR